MSHRPCVSRDLHFCLRPPRVSPDPGLCAVGDLPRSATSTAAQLYLSFRLSPATHDTVIATVAPPPPSRRAAAVDVDVQAECRVTHRAPLLSRAAASAPQCAAPSPFLVGVETVKVRAARVGSDGSGRLGTARGGRQLGQRGWHPLLL